MSISVGTHQKPHSTNIFLVNRSELLIIKHRESLFIRCVCFVLFRTQFISFFVLEKFIYSLIYPFNTMDRWMHVYYVLGTVTNTKQNRTNICSHGAYILIRVVLNPNCKEQLLGILIYLGRKQEGQKSGQKYRS